GRCCDLDRLWPWQSADHRHGQGTGVRCPSCEQRCGCRVSSAGFSQVATCRKKFAKDLLRIKLSEIFCAAAPRLWAPIFFPPPPPPVVGLADHRAVSLPLSGPGNGTVASARKCLAQENKHRHPAKATLRGKGIQVKKLLLASAAVVMC